MCPGTPRVPVPCLPPPWGEARGHGRGSAHSDRGTAASGTWGAVKSVLWRPVGLMARAGWALRSRWCTGGSRPAPTIKPGQTIEPGQIMILGQAMMLGQSMKPGQSMKRVRIGISVSGVTEPAGIGRERRFTAARGARSASALHPLRRGLYVSAEPSRARADASTIPAKPLGCWNFGFTWCDHPPQARASTRAALYPQRTRRAPDRGRSG